MPLGRAMDADGGAGGAGEVTIAGDVVGVRVGLHDVGDREPLLPGDPQIVVDTVAPGIDDHRASRLGAADEVGQAAGLLVEQLLEDQCFSARSLSVLASLMTLSAMKLGTSS